MHGAATIGEVGEDSPTGHGVQRGIPAMQEQTQIVGRNERGGPGRALSPS